MPPTCVSSRAVTTELIGDLKKKCGTVIGTHNGTFHQDEVVACFLLRLLKKYENAAIVRTRDDNLLDLCDVVVDVGSKFDVDANRFDHHQRDFDQTWDSTHTWTKLSSAGLIWRQFGRDILAEVYGIKDENTIALLHSELYNIVFEAIDGNDNGVRVCTGTAKYIGGMPSMSGSIASANTSWCIPERQDETQCFLAAYNLVDSDFRRIMDLLVHHYPHARAEILAALDQRATVHPSGRVVELNKYGMWKGFVRYLDPHKMDDDKHIAFVLYPISPEDYTVSFVGFDEKLHHQFIENFRKAHHEGPEDVFLNKEALLDVITKTLDQKPGDAEEKEVRME